MTRDIEKEQEFIKNIEKTTTREYEFKGKNYRESRIETVEDVYTDCNPVKYCISTEVRKEEILPDGSLDFIKLNQLQLATLDRLMPHNPSSPH